MPLGGRPVVVVPPGDVGCGDDVGCGFDVVGVATGELGGVGCGSGAVVPGKGLGASVVLGSSDGLVVAGFDG